MTTRKARVLEAPLSTRSVPAAHEMGAAEARRWAQTTERIGQDLLPVLEQLAGSLPSATAIMVSTGDGFNLCALGLSEEQVDRVSAMGSALHSVSRAATEALAGGEAHQPLDMLSITHGAHTTVVLTLRGLDHGQALLWVTGTQDSMGVMIFRARAAAAEIEAVFAEAAA